MRTTFAVSHVFNLTTALMHPERLTAERLDTAPKVLSRLDLHTNSEEVRPKWLSHDQWAALRLAEYVKRPTKIGRALAKRAVEQRTATRSGAFSRDATGAHLMTLAYKALIGEAPDPVVTRIPDLSAFDVDLLHVVLDGVIPLAWMCRERLAQRAVYLSALSDLPNAVQQAVDLSPLAADTVRRLSGEWREQMASCSPVPCRDAVSYCLAILMETDAYEAERKVLIRSMRPCMGLYVCYHAAQIFGPDRVEDMAQGCGRVWRSGRGDDDDGNDYGEHTVELLGTMLQHMPLDVRTECLLALGVVDEELGETEPRRTMRRHLLGREEDVHEEEATCRKKKKKSPSRAERQRRAAARVHAADERAAAEAVHRASESVRRAMALAEAEVEEGKAAAARSRLSTAMRVHHAGCDEATRRDYHDMRARLFGDKKKKEEVTMSVGDTSPAGNPKEECPITCERFKDPVLLVGDGYTYERAAIEGWLRRSSDSPMTGAALTSTQVVPNYTLRALLETTL